jgi:osmotically-inducible protein OsmY
MDTKRDRLGRWLLAGVAAIVVGCDGQDVERLARLSRKAVDRIQTHATDPQGRLTGTLQSIHGGWSDLTVDVKVSVRLRWDKDLHGANIQVRAGAHGVVELRGTVMDLPQRQRAVWVAESTVGVSEVIDQLIEAPR